jgi:hypothetical protein
MITIELFNDGASNIAKTSIGSDTFHVSHGRNDPVPMLCRTLLRGGHQEDCEVNVVRNGVSVFKRSHRLGRWGAISVVDHDVTGLKVREFSSFDREE